jgi:hypothetical protein
MDHAFVGASREGAIDRHNSDVEENGEMLPQNASAYSFRHSRISEMPQLHGIDPVTVAQQAGTSVAMIEKYYFRFIASAMQARLAAIRDIE